MVDDPQTFVSSTFLVGRSSLSIGFPFKTIGKLLRRQESERRLPFRPAKTGGDDTAGNDVGTDRDKPVENEVYIGPASPQNVDRSGFVNSRKS